MYLNLLGVAIAVSSSHFPSHTSHVSWVAVLIPTWKPSCQHHLGFHPLNEKITEGWFWYASLENIFKIPILNTCGSICGNLPSCCTQVCRKIEKRFSLAATQASSIKKKNSIENTFHTDVLLSSAILSLVQQSLIANIYF